MFVMTNKKLLNSYSKLADQASNVKNFRLYYENKPTNLIWYDGKIIFLPKEYFELKNLLNVDLNKKYKCSLYASEVKLIGELRSKEINFLLEDNLAELVQRVANLGESVLSDELSIEMTDDNDYTKIVEPIYLGEGNWLNLD